MDGLRIATWDDSQGEVILHEEKLRQIGFSKASVWEASLAADKIRQGSQR